MTKSNCAFTIWEVSGKVIIPGARKSADFGPVRIVDRDRQTASKHLAKVLNDKFKKEMRGEHRFSDHFALLNLKWEDFIQKTAPSTATE